MCIAGRSLNQLIDHFTVARLVTWPLNESDAGGDLILIETSLLFLCNDAFLMLISRNLHKKNSEVSIKARPPPASFSFKGQATKHNCKMLNLVPRACV